MKAGAADESKDDDSENYEDDFEDEAEVKVPGRAIPGDVLQDADAVQPSVDHVEPADPRDPQASALVLEEVKSEASWAIDSRASPPGTLEEDVPQPAGSEEVRVSRTKRTVYEQEEDLVETQTQEFALSWLQAQDPERTGQFTTAQLVQLVREIRGSGTSRSRKPKKPWDAFTCDVCIWLTFALILVWLSMIVAGALSQPVLTESSGALKNRDGQAAATASFLETHDLLSLPSMAPGTLRRIQDCTFVHQNAFHRIRVSSLVRTQEGQVVMTSAEGSQLTVEHPEGQDKASVSFSQPFVGEETVERFLLDSDDTPQKGLGCNFAMLTPTTKRSK